MHSFVKITKRIYQNDYKIQTVFALFLLNFDQIRILDRFDISQIDSKTRWVLKFN